MKKLLIILISLAFNFHLSAATFESKQLGISLEYPDNWRSSPVLEANKPESIFEAIRNGNDKEFLTLVVYPSIDLKVDKSRLESWTQEMVAGFDVENSAVKSSKVQTMLNGDWYSIVLKLNNDRITSYNIVLNGYSYSISFLNNTTKNKDFDKEIATMVNSIKLTVPENIKTVETYFEKAIKDTTTNLFIPEQFTMTKVLNKKESVPYVYSLYKNLLSQNSADYVLVANNMAEQLFCLNVKLGEKEISDETTTFLNKFVGNKFRQDGITYEEVTNEPWEKSDSVFLFKFRLTKKDVATTHYIFYCNKNAKTDIIKIQTPAVLEAELEPYFFKLILKYL